MSDNENSSGNVSEPSRLFIRQISDKTEAASENMEELQETLELFSQLAELGRIYAWEVYVSGLFTYITEGAEKVLGYRREEIINKMYFFDLVPEEERESVKANYFAAFAGKQAFLNYENLLQTKTGELLWVSTNGIPIVDSSGKLLGYRGTNTDITDRKKIEEALIAKEALQKLLINMATKFINVPLVEIDSAIAKMLGSIGDYVKADRAYIFLHDYDMKITRNTHEWCAAGITPEIDNLQNNSFELYSDVLEAHQKGELYHIPSVADMPEPHALKANFERQKIQSVVVLPILQAAEIIGFVGFDAVNEKKVFTETEIALLRVLAEIVANILSRQQVESKLAESEAYNRRIIEVIPDLIFIIDSKGHYLDVISSSDEMLFINKDELIGKKLIESLPENMSAEANEAFNKAIRENALQIFEYQMEVPAGKLWFEARMLPSGEDRVMVMVRNVSDRKKAEEELIKSRDQYQSLVDNVPGITYRCRFDEGWTMIYMSSDVYRITGYPPGDFIDNKVRNYSSVIHPDDEHNNRIISTAAKAGKSWDIEYRILHKDGSVRWVHEKGRGVLGNSGAVEFLDGLILDITERKMAEKALQEKSEELDNYFNSSLDLLCIANTDGEFVRVNPQWEKILGYMVAELEGRPFLDFVHPDDLEATLAAVASLAAQEELLSFTNRYLSRDGTYRWIEWHSKPKGKIIYAVARDITDRIKAEDALKYQLEFEKMLSAISFHFVNLPAEGLDNGIAYALKSVGEFFKADRNYVIRFSADGEYYSETHEWCAEGIESQLDNNQNFAVSETPWWVEQLRKNKFVNITDLNDMPPEAEKDKLDFISEGIKSILTIPMERKGELFGFLGFEAVNEKIAWPEDQINLLNIVAELILSAFIQNIAEERIRYLSFHDQLTGLYNRHFLAAEMARLDTKRQLPLSVIMADLNGLKLLNDTYGHEVGDEMLKAAADILKNVSRSEDIIARWGGDEFIYFLPQASRETAEEICERITAKSSSTYVKNMPVSLALGVATKTRQRNKIQEIINEAEEAMYKHKISGSRSIKMNVIKAMLKTLADISSEEEKHSGGMLDMAEKIAEKLSLPEAELSRLKTLIDLHDVGKIKLDKEILLKKGALTEEEWDAVRRHPEVGFRIARTTEDYAHVAEELLSHHERWDGTGYPRGLAGQEIPLLARITAVVEAFEVMSAGRPYKRAMSNKAIAAEFKKCAGSQFDPKLVEIFLKIFKNESD